MRFAISFIPYGILSKRCEKLFYFTNTIVFWLSILTITTWHVTLLELALQIGYSWSIIRLCKRSLMASISGIENVLSMIWRSWVQTPVRLNLECVVCLSKSYLNQKNLYYCPDFPNCPINAISGNMGNLDSNIEMDPQQCFTLNNCGHCRKKSWGYLSWPRNIDCNWPIILIYQGVHCCTKVCNLRITDCKASSNITWELRMLANIIALCNASTFCKLFVF